MTTEQPRSPEEGGDRITRTGHIVGATYRSAYWGHTYKVLGEPSPGEVEVEALDDRSVREAGERWAHRTDVGDDALLSRPARNAPAGVRVEEILTRCGCTNTTLERGGTCWERDCPNYPQGQADLRAAYTRLGRELADAADPAKREELQRNRATLYTRLCEDMGCDPMGTELKAAEAGRAWLGKYADPEQAEMASPAEVVEQLEHAYPTGAVGFRRDHLSGTLRDPAREERRRQRARCMTGSHPRYEAGDAEAIGAAIRDLITTATVEEIDLLAIRRRLEVEVPLFWAEPKPGPLRTSRRKEAAELRVGDSIWVGSAFGFVEVLSVEGLPDFEVSVCTTRNVLVLPASFDLLALEPVG
jgi:hypothetical protein